MKRITVNLSDRTRDDLGWIGGYLSAGQTEAVARALALARFLLESQAAGAQICLRSSGGKLERVRLL